MAERLRIALLVETSRGYGRSLLRGIAAYAREHGPWSFFFEERSLVDCTPPKLKQWRPDGIIARVGSRAFGRQLRRWGLPVVNLTQEQWGCGFPLATPDSEKIARLAVDHLLDRGLRELGFCGLPKILWSLERERYFIDCVRARGLRPHVLRHPSPKADYAATMAEARRHVQELAGWLRELPKPVGLLTCNDERALQVATVCGEIGLKVPDQVAILGVNNDELACELSDPPLSSVDVGAERVGWQAAKVLHAMVLGGETPPATTLVPPLGVVVRRSTDILVAADADMTSIASYIRQHACEGLTVRRLVKEFSTSRSTLQRWFGEQLGHSANVEIARVRVQRVEELLATTDLSLGEIAARLGFRHLETMHHVFKRWTGQTPGEYRSHARSQAGVRRDSKFGFRDS